LLLLPPQVWFDAAPRSHDRDPRPSLPDRVTVTLHFPPIPSSASSLLFAPQILTCLFPRGCKIGL
jgi:hypothetical protein